MIQILLAVYNNAKYLRAQLESICNQSYSNWQLVISDDCSTDNSVAIVEEFQKLYPNKIILIKNSINKGAKQNFSALMQAVNKEVDYVMFSDADDIWLPNKIEKTLEQMIELETRWGKTTPLLVHSDLKVVDHNLKCIKGSFWKYSCLSPSSAEKLNRMLIHNVVTGCTMMLNLSLLKLSCPIPKQAIMHDWWITLVACVFGKIAALSEKTILYRQHQTNFLGAKNWSHWSTYQTMLLKFFKNSERQGFRKQINYTFEQAEEFLFRFEYILPEKKKDLIKNFLKLKNSNWIKKRELLLKHHFFKNTFIKNIAVFYLL